MEKEKVFQILVEICGDEIILEERNIDLFEEGLLDSMGTISLLVEFDNQLNINVPITVFDKEKWNTPNNIVSQLEIWDCEI